MSQHSFDIDDAAKYGILPAVIIHNIRFWTEKNRANRRHFYEGKTWVYNSVSAWSELFPYATKDQIRRALEKLREEGVIEVGNFNQSAYDRTAWFCLSCQIQMANLPNGNGTDATPIPVGNPVSNPDSKPLNPAHAPASAPAKPKKFDAMSFDHSPIPADLWQGFVEHRKQIRKPITERAAQQILADYCKARSSGKDADACIKDSIRNGWQGVFFDKAGMLGSAGQANRNAPLHQRRADTIAALTGMMPTNNQQGGQNERTINGECRTV